MNQQANLLSHDAVIETWNEELSRARKYKEAVQKRRAEKLAGKQIEKLKIASQAGRLKPEL